jgi:hypothetical protein
MEKEMNKMQDLKKKHDILKAKNNYLALLSAYEKEKVEEEAIFDPFAKGYNMYFERAKNYLTRNYDRISVSMKQEHFEFLNRKKDRIPTDALITEGHFLGYNCFERNTYYASWWYKKNWERIIKWFVFGE